MTVYLVVFVGCILLVLWVVFGRIGRRAEQRLVEHGQRPIPGTGGGDWEGSRGWTQGMEDAEPSCRDPRSETQMQSDFDDALESAKMRAVK